MAYVDGFVCPVSNAKREAYIAHAQLFGAMFKEFGATSVVECWGDDVPEGKLTSFPLAVKREEGESVVFSWVSWPSREVRDAGWKAMMADPRMVNAEDPPFDGKRLIYGGFEKILDI
jgi:uncharacterized protein YbaA (DUF1428 family)